MSDEQNSLAQGPFQGRLRLVGRTQPSWCAGHLPEALKFRTSGLRGHSVVGLRRLQSGPCLSFTAGRRSS
jgi:hypothetical protein